MRHATQARPPRSRRATGKSGGGAISPPLLPPSKARRPGKQRPGKRHRAMRPASIAATRKGRNKSVTSHHRLAPMPQRDGMTRRRLSPPCRRHQAKAQRGEFEKGPLSRARHRPPLSPPPKPGAWRSRDPPCLSLNGRRPVVRGEEAASRRPRGPRIPGSGPNAQQSVDPVRDQKRWQRAARAERKNVEPGRWRRGVHVFGGKGDVGDPGP